MDTFIFKPQELFVLISSAYEKKANYPIKKSMILGFLAGAYISFGGFAASVASHSIENFGVAKFISGIIFPVGLILIILCGTDLFTGNILLTVPLLDKKIKYSNVVKNWIIVYFANFLGAFFIAFLLVSSGALDMNQGLLGTYVIKVAAAKGAIPFWKALSSGILCNIMVCLAVWCSFAAKDVTGKILAIWFPIMTFVVAGFEHSIANMYYFSVGILAKASGLYTMPQGKDITISGALGNLLPVTIGNILGGAIFVALLFYLSYGKKNNIKTSHKLSA